MGIKPVVTMMVAGAALLALSGPAAAEREKDESVEARVVLDGLVQQYSGRPFIQDGIYYLPVRELLEGLGYTIRWNGQTGSIEAYRHGSKALVLEPNKSDAVLGAKIRYLGQKVRLVDGSAFMPGESVLELLGYQVDTDAYRARFYIKSPVWMKIADAVEHKPKSIRMEGEASGFGASRVSLYLDGELVYSGDWKQGMMEGGGQLYDGGRLVYEGGIKGNKPEGWGILHHADGRRYEGMFLEGLPHGAGRLYSKDKLLYEGQWVYGTEDGNGKLYDSKGEILYEGGMVRGFRNGYGIEYDESGHKVYEGSWVDGKRSGSGKAFNSEGKITFSGLWQNDKKHGKGTDYRFGKVKSYSVSGTNITSAQEVDALYVKEVEYIDGTKTSEAKFELVHRGSFTEEGELNGPGEAGTVTGSALTEAGLLHTWEPHYKGDFRYGVMTGNGIFYDSRGRVIYEGEVKDGKRHGTGTEYEKGLIRYRGPWENDRKNGKGWNYEQGTPPFQSNMLSVSALKITPTIYSNGALKSMGEAYLSYGSFTGSKYEGRGTQIWLYNAGSGSDPSGVLQKVPGGAIVYEGDMQFGLRSGKGSEYMPDGSRYTGDFLNNQRNGFGKLAGIYVTYEGEFKNGMKNGYGKLYAGGILQYEGEFKDDKKNGYGKLYDYWGTSVQYSGEFKDDMTAEAYRALHP